MKKYHSIANPSKIKQNKIEKGKESNFFKKGKENAIK